MEEAAALEKRCSAAEMAEVPDGVEGGGTAEGVGGVDIDNRLDVDDCLFVKLKTGAGTFSGGVGLLFGTPGPFSKLNET